MNDPNRNPGKESRMNKLFAFMLTLIVAIAGLIIPSTSMSAFAAASQDTDFTTTLGTDGEMLITGLSEEGENSRADDNTVIIPSIIDGTPVTGIADRAFSNLDLESVIFPETSIQLGEGAFQGNKLTKVTINTESIGANAFAQNNITEVTLTGTETIGSEAFRDNKISALNLGDSLTTIGDRAFMNNKLDTVTFPETLEVIGSEGFSINQIREVTVPTGTTLNSDVFSRNGSWVKVLTESPTIDTTRYDSGYGHVVNPVTANVRFVDTDGADIMTPDIIGDDLMDEDNVFGLNQESIYTPPTINGYKLLTQSPVVFTPDRDGYEIVVEYEKVNTDPIISDYTGKKFDANAQVGEAELLAGVKAESYDRKNITGSLTVEPKNIDTTIPGTHDVYYTATDADGNTVTVKSTVLVGIDWGKVEVGGGWLVEDFRYNGVNITGFSSLGQAKLDAGNTVLYLPTHTLDGRLATGYASGFSSKGLTGIGSWGEITSIWGTAFDNNKLTVLPDSWDKITSIGERVFRGNQLTSLPDSWDKITSIGNQTFYNNELTSLPDSWDKITSIGNWAFRNNQLTSLSGSWGEVKSIGNYAFSYNELTSLPDSWGEITSIGGDAFYNNELTSLPDSWGEITSIGMEAFSSNQLTSLPDSWDKITSIGFSAFQNNQLTSLPDSWGEITSIESNAFQNNELTSLSGSWGKITSIGSNAFRDNQLTSLPDSWGEITIIGNNAFYGNELTSLPDSWDKITSIGGYVFSSNQLTSLPDSWGEITSIGNNAFDDNNLTSLPDSWGEITSIGGSAFQGNELTSLPDSWGEITSIGYRAFHSYYNHLTSREYTIADANLTQSFVNGLNSSQHNKSAGNPIYLITENRTNPHNVVSPNDTIIINPTTINVTYVDENGEELMESTRIIVHGQDNHTVSASPIYGYHTPEDVTVTLDTGIVNHTFTYVKMTEGELLAAQNSNISVVTNDRDYYIGDMMSGVVRIDRSGYDTSDIVNPTIRVDLPGGVFTNKVEVTNIPGLSTSNLAVHDGYFTFQYDGVIAGGTTVEIPFLVHFKKYSTPENTPFPVYATLIDGDTAVARSGEDTFIGHYNNPYMTIHANGSTSNGTVTNYDQTVVSNDNPPISHVSVDGENSITYRITVYDLDRNVSDYTYQVQLPMYDVHPDSGVAADENGQARAVFNPDLNPGWTLGDDGVTLTYSGDHGDKHSSIVQSLVLNYPGSEEMSNIPVAANAVLTPTDKPVTEDVMTLSNRIVNNFFKVVPPSGEVFVKRAVGPQRNGIYFYDNNHGRNQDFGWLLYYQAPTSDITNVNLIDNQLDDRMYYSHAVLPANNGEIVVTVLDANGGSLFTESFDKGGTVTFPENIRDDIDSVSFRLVNDLKKGDSGSITLYTKLKNPDESHFDSTAGSAKNKFHNNLDFTSDQVNSSWGADKVILSRDQVIQATKSSSFGGDTITGQEGTYTVGFHARHGFGDTITDFTQVDLVPAGLEVTGYSMSNEFARIPGANVELVDNYNNSGQTAVVWTAPEIPYTMITPGTTFTVGSVSTWIGMEVVGGTMTNDVFVHAQETGLANVVQDDRLPAGEWSKASASTDVTAATVMVQRKNIRTYNDEDVAGPWVINTATTPGQKIDYRLRVTNGTDTPRTGAVVYDVLPFVGDLGLTGMTPYSRESEFANVMDLTRDITVPDGMKVQYYNGEVPVYHLGDATEILEGLAWVDTPFADTTAIRVIPVEGTTFTLEERSSFDIIIPMLANTETNGYPGVPSDNTVDKTAWNSFYYMDDQQDRLIEGNRVSNTMVREPVTVEFLKTGLLGGLSGATFQYQRADGTVVSTITSDSDGMVRFSNIYAQAGDRIVETEAPTAYRLSSEIREITDETLMDYYTSGGTGAIVLPEFKNTIPWVPLQPVTGDLSFTKVDINGEPLANINFQLTRTWEYNGTTFNSLYEARSNAEGVVTFRGVTPAADYTLTEVSAPGHLSVIDPITDVRVIGNEMNHVGDTYEGVENAVVNDNVGLRIAKIGVNEDRLTDDEGNLRLFGSFGAVDGGRLAGAELDIINVATDEVVGTVTTTTGDDVISGLTPGVIYRVVERVEPADWNRIEGLDMTFQVSPQGSLLSADGSEFPVQTRLFVPNEREEKLSTILVNKTGAGDVLEGAVFRLDRQVENGWEPVSEATTGTDGVASWMDLTHGVYRVSEVSAPAGFTRSFNTREFTLPRYESRTFTWNVDNIQSNPVINKVEYLGRGLSNQNAAESLIIEMGNPEGVEVIQNGNTYDVIQRLAGATFELRDNPQGAALEILVTDDNGYAAVTTPLNENQVYYLVETEAPEGYRAITEPVQFRVIDHARLSGYNGTINIMVKNNKDLGRLVISKLDDGTGTALINGSATFMVEKLVAVTDGEPVGEYNGVSYQVDSVVTDDLSTSTENGLAVLENLEFGVYRVTETVAPDGYSLDQTPRIFEVTRDEATFTHLFTNIPETMEIGVVKKINGQDANNDLEAVWLGSDTETMEVSFTITNTGTIPLRNVTLTDVTEGDNPDLVNALIENATVTVTNNVNERWGTVDGEFTNGEFTMSPGATATLTVTAPAPSVGEMHVNTVTVIGYSVFNDAPVTDDDPAQAFRLPVAMPLPMTGEKSLVIFGILFLVIVGGTILYIRKTRL